MKKVYRKLTVDQKQRGVVFSSVLSYYTTEQDTDGIHEVLYTDPKMYTKIQLLKDDSFFNICPYYRYNIIRE